MPADSSQQLVLLDQLADEFAARFRRGERPLLEEYIEQHPQMADEIREFFPALVAIERVKEDRQEVTEPAAAGPVPSLERLGDFRIIREIGHGGMGVVYEAEQVSLGRHVALKVLPKQLLADRRARQRFEREAKAAARLHHTNIVPVFGVGEHEGLPYYVMQFIPGLGLDQVLTELRGLKPGTKDKLGEPCRSDGEVHAPRQDVSAAEMARALVTGQFTAASGEDLPVPAPSLEETIDHGTSRLPAASGVKVMGEGLGRGIADTPVAGRLSDTYSLSSSSVVLPGVARESGSKQPTYWQSVARLGVQVAEALEHAHALGVLHRDIKPSNLLLDTAGTVWVADFGLAKAQADGDNLTHTGDIVGTLRYMAPERFSGQGDVRSDVYSLGLTLYELLTLRPAFAEADRNQLIKQVMHDEPVRPRKVNPAVPRDLETVVLKAISRDPAHRYRTPAQLAEDLKRYLEDRPIRARRVSEAERFWRWCRRNPELAGLAASLVLSLVIGVVATTLKWREAEHQRGLAVEENQQAQESRRDAETARNEAFSERHASQRQSADLLFERGVALAEQGEAAQGLHWMLESLKVAPADAADLRHVVRVNLAAWGEHVHGLRHMFPNPEGWARGLTFSPDGKTFVLANNNHVLLCKTDTGERIGKPMPGGGAFITALALSPDGKSVLLGKRDGEVQLWDLTTFALTWKQSLHRDEIRSMAFSPDGKMILTGSEDRTARLWDAATRKPLQDPFQHDIAVLSVAFSPDGKKVLTSTGAGRDDAAEEESGQGVVYVWDVATGAQLGPPLAHPGGVYAAGFSPDGQVILTGGTDGTGRLWDRATGQPKGVPLRHRHRVEQVGFTPDGSALLTASERAFSAFLWDTKTGQRIGTPLWHQEHLQVAAISPDGKNLLTGGSDRTYRLWQLSRSLSRPADPNADSHKEIIPGRRREERLVNYLLGRITAYSPDRKTVLVSDGGKLARLWDTHTGQPKGAPLRHAQPVRAVAFSPDGNRVATSSHTMQAGPETTVHLWDAATGRPLAPPIIQPNWVAALAFSPDGRVLAIGSYWGGVVRLWDLNTNKPLDPPIDTKGIVFDLSFSPDGKTLATGSVENPNVARLWDVATRRRVGKDMPHRNWVWKVIFSPDGKLLLTLSNDRNVRLWDAATTEPRSDYLPHQGLTAAAFSPGGKTLATGGGDDRAQLWDVQTGRPVHGATFVHGSRVAALAFSPDGRILGTGGMDGSGRLWDVATFKSLGPPLVQRGEIADVAFTPDGHAFLTTARDGSTRVWPVPTPLEGDLERITLQIQVRTGMQMDAGQAVAHLDPATWNARRRKLIDAEGTDNGAYRTSVSDEDYHAARAADAEQDRATFTALWQLDRLVALRPQDWLLHARRGRAYSSAGQLDMADAAYKQAAKYASADALIDWYRHRVADCEAAGQEATAHWYEDRVKAGEPDGAGQ